MAAANQKTNIFSFYDYREYLRTFYEQTHAVNAWFSYRYIQQKTGINPGFLYKVFQGEKHLPRTSLPAFIKLLGLKKRQEQYLSLMYSFAKARSNEEIKIYFEKMLSFADPSYTQVNSNTYKYYTKWYYAAVRQILAVLPFVGDYEALSRMTLPAITVTEAKDAVSVLEKLKFIKKKPDNSYEVTAQHLSTGEHWHSIAIRSFQQQMIQLSHQALDTIPKEERDISTVTVMLSAEDFEIARERIKQFRKDIMDLTEREGAAQQSYNVNIQMFPITTRLQ